MKLTFTIAIALCLGLFSTDLKAQSDIKKLNKKTLTVQETKEAPQMQETGVVAPKATQTSYPTQSAPSQSMNTNPKTESSPSAVPRPNQKLKMPAHTKERTYKTKKNQ
ncbi:MAG: hypothetical protein N4A46_10235 [Schleiferiaceae bacterium]|jgi:hypothetical protein|nr:hypothetical protein [Schleiferiaceae bacterium]